MVAAAELLLDARGQRELLAFMQRDYQNTRAKRRCRRGARVCSHGQHNVVSGLLRAQVPEPLSFESEGVVALPACVDALGVDWSTMVDVDDDRLNVLARGARCVSLSSTKTIRAFTLDVGD